MNLNSIDHGHPIQRFKPILLKTSGIMSTVFKQVNEFQGQKQISTYDKLIDDIIQILEITPWNSSTSSSAKNSIRFV
jgi:hypothetical protein